MKNVSSGIWFENQKDIDDVLSNFSDNGAIFSGSVDGSISIPANESFSVEGSSVVLSALPTSDPVITGALWNDSGTVKVSSGS
jgi:hypothetical protein